MPPSLQLRELDYDVSRIIQHFGAIGVPTFDCSKSVPGNRVQPKSSERVAAGAVTFHEVFDGVFDNSLRLDFDDLTKAREPRSPMWPHRPEPLSHNLTFDDVGFQLAADRSCALDAHADEPRSPTGKRFDRGDSDPCFKTLSDHEPFAHIEIHCAAHSAAPRFAAAIASWAFVYRKPPHS